MSQSRDYSFYRRLKYLLRRPAIKVRRPADNRPANRFEARMFNVFAKAASNQYMQSIAGSTERLARTRDFEMQDLNSPIISTALNIWADDSTSLDEDGKILKVLTSNQRIKLILEDLFYDRLNVNFNLWHWIRNTSKYGDFFLLLDVIENDGIVSSMPLPTVEVEREEGYDGDINSVRFRWNTASGAVFENYQIAHFRMIGDDTFLPYGKSNLEATRKVWKQLNLIEDAMLTYRIQRAPERRVFKIDIGGINPNDVPGFMQKAKDILKRQPLVDQQGNIDLRYNVAATDEDFFLPVRAGQSSTDISTLPGACLSLETKIKLLDGRNETLQTLIDEYESGKQNWVYSCNPKTGAIVVSPITWAGITRKNTDIMKITLDNGESIICTLDHKFPTWNKGEKVEAKDLEASDDLMKFEKEKECASTIKITKIEYLTEKIDVGTITVDGDEKYNNYHTFALECGTFVKNSNLGDIEDIRYVQCLRGNVKIKLLNGTSKSIKDIIDENDYSNLYTLSVNPKTLQLEPTKIISGKKTRLNAELIRVHLDNKEFIDCTPDHLFMMKDGSYKQAQDLKEDDSLMPLYTKINENGNFIYNPSTNNFENFNDVVYNDYMNTNALSFNEILNHKVVKIEKLNEREDTYDIQVSLNSNFALDSGIFVHNSNLIAALGIPRAYLTFEDSLGGKTNLSQEDLRFAKTIQRIQKMHISELTKIAQIHLFALGYQDVNDLTSFKLGMTNPSTVQDQMKLEYFEKKFMVYTAAIQSVGVDRKYAQKKILKLSDRDIERIELGIKRDAKLNGELQGLTQLAQQETAPQQQEGDGSSKPGEVTPAGQAPVTSIPGGQADGSNAKDPSIFRNQPDKPMTGDNGDSSKRPEIDEEEELDDNTQNLKVKDLFFDEESDKKDNELIPKKKNISWLNKSLHEQIVISRDVSKIFINMEKKLKKNNDLTEEKEKN